MYEITVEKDDSLVDKYNVVIQKNDRWWSVFVGTEEACNSLSEELRKGFKYIEGQD